MDNKEYSDKHYACTATYLSDSIKVRKIANLTDFSITTNINNVETGNIVVRGKEQAEQLHFMLGRLLEKI